MVFAVPEYTPEEVNKAAKAMLDGPFGSSGTVDWKHYAVWEQSLTVINNWRSAHSYPLHVIYVGLSKKAKTIDKDRLGARRTKRLASIESKLKLRPTMKLSQMQDIGGCRAILNNVSSVQKLVNSYKKSSIRHKLIKEDDYIDAPKESGYRGIHLIYRYNSDTESKKIYNDFKIEIQIRTKLQHAWATAVEIFGTFTKQALKSSQGNTDWLRFFALMGTVIAIREKSPLVPNTPQNKKELKEELRNLAESLRVRNVLDTMHKAIKITKDDHVKNAHYYLLILDSEKQEVIVRGFKARERSLADKKYLETEKEIKDNPNRNAVLVAVESLSSLERAYPNYFLDTQEFIKVLDLVLKD